MSTKYIAQIAGFYLDIINMQDTFENALVSHEYVNTSKNIIENLGQKTRRVSVSCSFQDDPAITPGWELDTGKIPDYNNHINFLETIRHNTGDVLFIHPKYGELHGKIENISTSHDNETLRQVDVSFDFWQEISDFQAQFVQYIIPQVAAGFKNTNTNMIDVLERERKDAVDSTTWEGEVAVFRSTLNSFYSTITNNTQSLIYTIDYGTDIPGLMVQDMNKAVDRIVEFYETSRSAPASFINNLIFGARELKAIFTSSEAQIVHIMSASIIAYEAGVILNEDEENRRNIDNKKDKETFDISGNYEKGPDFEDTLTINELETMLANVRGFIDEAIQYDRNNRGLSDQSRFLQNYVNQIKLNREKIIVIQANNEPLHSVLSRYDLSHQLADRILKLNPDIMYPSFVSGDTKIIVPPDYESAGLDTDSSSESVPNIFAYVISIASGTLSELNVSNSNNIILLRTLTGLNSPRDIKISGNYAFITNSGNMVSVDLRSMTIADTISHDAGNDIYLQNPSGLDIEGNYAYVADGTLLSLTIFNIANPASITQTGYLTGGITMPYYINSIIVNDSYVYTAIGYDDSENAGGIGRIDATIPGAPSAIDFLADAPTNGLNSCQDMCISEDNTRLFVNNDDDPSLDGVTCISIGNPLVPMAFVSRINNGDGIAMDRNNPIVRSGNYIYTGSKTTDNISIIDITDTNDLKGIMTFYGNALNNLEDIQSLVIFENFLYVCANAGDTYSIYDITNPESPILTDTILSGEQGSLLDQPFASVVVRR